MRACPAGTRRVKGLLLVEGDSQKTPNGQDHPGGAAPFGVCSIMGLDSRASRLGLIDTDVTGATECAWRKS